jgi:DNA-binding XRE family transcriptional regulator
VGTPSALSLGIRPRDFSENAYSYSLTPRTLAAMMVFFRNIAARDANYNGALPMPRVIIPPASRKQIATLRANGQSLATIGRRFGVSKQGIHQVLRADASHRVIRCRECDCPTNGDGAMPRDDWQVLCLACLAVSPHATFGEHLKSYRLAAGLRLVELAKRSGVCQGQISAYEQGHTSTPSWSIQRRLFAALRVKMVVEK